MTMPSRLVQSSLAAILTVVALAAPAAAKSQKHTIILDGLPETVNFNDGDSFRILDGPRKGQKARLVGYNTLEAYGPVHFWGDGNGWDFYHVNEKDIDVAKSEEWECESLGTADGYGRILVLCPELRKRLVSEGLAHVYAYGKEEPDPELVQLMLKAQNERRGMWKYGVPVAIVTSVHSIDEKGSDDEGFGSEPRKMSYNRLADTRTGKTFAIEHDKVFKPCDVFCSHGSCMVYVPFDVRFGDARPACLRGDGGEKNRMGGPRHLDEPMLDHRRR
ncbi:MAG: thermonuclease family protein [Deltaproteobacteria bacterium]|nr:thermonuclease family protein [Deltaproteobacteria bacterium]